MFRILSALVDVGNLATACREGGLAEHVVIGFLVQS